GRSPTWAGRRRARPVGRWRPAGAAGSRSTRRRPRSGVDPPRGAAPREGQVSDWAGARAAALARRARRGARRRAVARARARRARALRGHDAAGVGDGLCACGLGAGQARGRPAGADATRPGEAHRTAGTIRRCFDASADASAGAYGPYLAALRRRLQEAFEYPAAARRRGLSGTVHLEIALEATGRVSEVMLVRSSSHALLDDAALDAARGLRRVPFPPEV